MRIKFIPAIFVFPFFLTFALPELNAQDEGSDIFDKLKKQRYEVSSENVLNDALKDTKYEHTHGIEWDARLKIIKGETILRPKNSLKMTKHSPGTEIPLEKGDTIKVYPKSEAEIRLYDKAIFRLYPNTEIEIISIEKTDTYLELKYGYMTGKVKPFKDKKHSLKLKTAYTNSKITAADFAAGYVRKNKTTGIAVFDSGVMSVSAINEMGLSLGLYDLKDNQEIIYSALLPDKDEEGRTKDDPDYKMKDIDINPLPINQMQELREKQAEISKINMKKEWAKYEEGQRGSKREQAIGEGEIMLPAPAIIKKQNTNVGNETNDPDAEKDPWNANITDADFKIKK